MIHFAEAENHFNSSVIFYQHESITPKIYNLIFKIYFLILKYIRNEVFFDLKFQSHEYNEYPLSGKDTKFR